MVKISELNLPKMWRQMAFVPFGFPEKIEERFILRKIVLFDKNMPLLFGHTGYNYLSSITSVRIKQMIKEAEENGWIDFIQENEKHKYKDKNFKHPKVAKKIVWIQWKEK